MSFTINNTNYQLYVGSTPIEEAYVGSTLVYSNKKYTFTLSATSSSSSNVGVNIGFQIAGGSGFANIPFTLNGTNYYSGTTTNGTQFFTNASMSHDYNIAVKKNYSEDYAVWANVNTNVANINSVTISSTLPYLNGYHFLDGAANLTSFSGGSITITNLASCFQNCRNLTNLSGLSNWNVALVNSLSSTFNNCRNLTTLSGLSNWNTWYVDELGYAFDNCANITNLTGLNNWNTVRLVSMQCTFYNCTNLSNIEVFNGWNKSNLVNMYYTFRNSGLSSVTLTNQNTRYLQIMVNTFSNCKSMTSANLYNWSVVNLTNMVGLFCYDVNLTSVNLYNWNTINVTNMAYMMTSCSKFNNASQLGILNTNKVTSMFCMFDGCTNLTNISGLSGWNVSSVTNMAYMFNSCYNITNLNALNSWTGANANCVNMFSTTTNLSGSFKVQWNITCAANMFRNRDGCPRVNIFASQTTNAYNAIYRAMGNSTTNSSWMANLYPISGNGVLDELNVVTYADGETIEAPIDNFYITPRWCDASGNVVWQGSTITFEGTKSTQSSGSYRTWDTEQNQSIGSIPYADIEDGYTFDCQIGVWPYSKSIYYYVIVYFAIGDYSGSGTSARAQLCSKTIDGELDTPDYDEGAGGSFWWPKLSLSSSTLESVWPDANNNKSLYLCFAISTV